MSIYFPAYQRRLHKPKPHYSANIKFYFYQLISLPHFPLELMNFFSCSPCLPSQKNCDTLIFTLKLQPPPTLSLHPLRKLLLFSSTVDSSPASSGGAQPTFSASIYSATAKNNPRHLFLFFASLCLLLPTAFPICFLSASSPAPYSILYLRFSAHAVHSEKPLLPPLPAIALRISV